MPLIVRDEPTQCKVSTTRFRCWHHRAEVSLEAWLLLHHAQTQMAIPDAPVYGLPKRQISGTMSRRAGGRELLPRPRQLPALYWVSLLRWPRRSDFLAVEDRRCRQAQCLQ